jgi:hypothetical protein
MNILNNKGFLFEKRSWNKLLITFFVIGFAIRLFHLCYNRSLWIDEIYLSTSLVKMNFKELLSEPLYYQQKAPLGFLLLVKLLINLFGSKEYILRIIPFVSGVLAMFLFIPVSKYFLKGLSSILAIGILCLAPAIIYHSVEIKQYSTELLGSILSLYLLIRFKESAEIKNKLVWGLFGAILLWFSYSSIFILAGISIGLSLHYLLKKEWRLFFINVIPFTIWLISFALNYILFTHKHAESQWIVYWFKAYDNFMPFPPKSITDLKWFAVNLYRMMDYPLGLIWNFNSAGSTNSNIILKMPFIPIILFFVGCLAILLKNRKFSFILLPPVILMFIASGLQLYPLTERFWLFISPIFIIFICYGFDLISEKIRFKSVSIILFILLITGPFIQAFSSIVHPENFFVHKKSFQREALMYVNNNFKANDAVYIYWNDMPGYNIYSSMYKLKYKAIEGTDQRKNSSNFEEYYHNLENDFKKFSDKKRIWVIYNTQFVTDIGDKIDDPSWYYIKNSNPTDHLINQLLKYNQLIKKYSTKDVTVCLLKPNKD